MPAPSRIAASVLCLAFAGCAADVSPGDSSPYAATEASLDAVTCPALPDDPEGATCSGSTEATPSCFVALGSGPLRREIAQTFTVQRAGVAGRVRLILNRLQEVPEDEATESDLLVELRPLIDGHVPIEPEYTFASARLDKQRLEDLPAGADGEIEIVLTSSAAPNTYVMVPGQAYALIVSVGVGQEMSVGIGCHENTLETGDAYPAGSAFSRQTRSRGGGRYTDQQYIEDTRDLSFSLTLGNGCVQDKMIECGVGECYVTMAECADGVFQTCVAKPPSAEICDLKDNDCDGDYDELGDLGVTTCGVGECERTFHNCDSGSSVDCVPGPPALEQCNGRDDDCDGATDEIEDLERTTCGHGLCEVTVDNCVEGEPNLCSPALANRTVESCNGADDDCDGAFDEDASGLKLTRANWPYAPEARNKGVCKDGIDTCTVEETAEPHTPLAESWALTTAPIGPSPESCNGLDDDCDDAVDESLSRACWTFDEALRGVGVCSDGVETCAAVVGSGDERWGACVGQTAPGVEICDGLDNDCDGEVDEVDDLGTTTCGVGECVRTINNCEGGVVQTCVAGPPAIEQCNLLDDDCDGEVDELSALGTTTCGAGLCRHTIDNCVAGVTQVCAPDTTRQRAEVCNGVDDDCDGAFDEDTDGDKLTRAYWPHSQAQRGEGVCRDGVETCTTAQSSDPFTEQPAVWEVTTQPVDPATETCNGFDDNCDGSIDESLARACWTHPAAKRGVGVCSDGTQTCASATASGIETWGTCVGQTAPSAELCDGQDNNCDGTVDDGQGTTTCGEGLCRRTMSNCAEGSGQTCVPDWSKRQTEICNGIDDDCDGDIDEELGSTTCGDGLCQRTMANCVDGVPQTCSADLSKREAETCNGRDDDCDGAFDEDAAGARLTRDYWPDDADEQGVGICRDGVQTCNVARTSEPHTARPESWAVTTAPVQATTESCNGFDDDCDGSVDESLSRACWTFDSSKRDVGICTDGSQSCTATLASGVARWGACSGQTAPGTETCDGLDNDCNGTTDDGLGAATCGHGRCARPMAKCVDGVPQACTPDWSKKQDETCNGIDDDCDGEVDEDLGNATCGQGVCQRSMPTCVNGVPQTCTPDTSRRTAEACNGIDDDCDGAFDEDAAGAKLTQAYWPWSSAIRNRGVCEDGVRTCNTAQSSEPHTPRPASWTVTTPARGPSTETCNGFDDDCDGTRDDGLQRACWDYSAGKRNVGQCSDGTQACNAVADSGTERWGSCVGQTPPATEACDGRDNDCDGATDESLGSTTCGVGECRRTVNKCSGGVSQSCVPGTPRTETCNGRDDDCNGQIDEVADLGTTTCGYGMCQRTVNRCVAGSAQTCTPDASQASAESCNGVDDDCDGQYDEKSNGTKLTRGYWPYSSSKRNRGICRDGTQTCNTSRATEPHTPLPESWALTTSPVAPRAETCNGFDDDCDGSQDEGLSRGCWTFASSKRNVGICRDGAQVCTSVTHSGSERWGTCAGQVGPTVEVCDGRDNDCDGSTDESLGSSTCGFGLCRRTMANCSGGSPQACTPDLSKRRTEICNGIDDDCDGHIDENAVGAPMTQSCYTGTGGTLNVGICRAGVQTCTSGVWSGCSGQTVPRSEINRCNRLDDNCNGATDDPSTGICARTSGVTATNCVSGACDVTACSANRYDVDNVYSNGCECVNDPARASCGGVTAIATTNTGQSASYTGKLPAAGTSDWLRVSFPASADYYSHSPGTPRIRLSSNPGGIFRFEVRTYACAGGRWPGCGASLTDWTFRDSCATSGLNCRTRNRSWPSNVFVRVYRTTGGLSCASYTLSISRVSSSCACADDGNPCTEERCTASGACVHEAGNAGAVCRAAANSCDTAEVCSGTSKSCPTNRFKAAGTACGSSSSTDCDAPDSCNGAGTCVDRVDPSNVLCRAGGGFRSCLQAEYCTGSSKVCPPDVHKPYGSFCGRCGSCYGLTCYESQYCQ